jgi:MFS family permease
MIIPAPLADGETQSPRYSSALITTLGAVAAFCAYFCMYAFRKPIAAAEFSDIRAGWLGIDYKTLVIIAQVAGYAASKLIGVRVIAETGRRGRGKAIVGLIALSWIALILFAIVPAPWNAALMILNGLPLGMIWGLVFSYLEGRRNSELLGAILCASFILSSGVVKTVATLLMAAGVSEFWMPAATGALFFPLLFVSVAVLEKLPPPDAEDERERAPRMPMDGASRRTFLREHGLALVLLVAGYVLLTAIRDFRDNFAAELWAGLGYSHVAAVFSASELPVAVIALGGLGALMLIRANMRALLVMHGVVIAGAVLLGLATFAFQAGVIGPILWMILTGAGLYLSYTPFNAMLFDRMIAAIGKAGNAGFLIYIADASGYCGSVALLLYRSFADPGARWLPFFITCCYTTAVVVGLLTLASAFYFHHRGRRMAELALV